MYEMINICTDDIQTYVLIVLHMFAKHILHEICKWIFVHMYAKAGH